MIYGRPKWRYLFGYPLVRVLRYTPALMDVERVGRSLEERGNQAASEARLRSPPGCWAEHEADAIVDLGEAAAPASVAVVPLPGMVRDTFQNLLGPAKQMQTQYLPQIQQKAATLDVGQVMAMVRGG